MTDNRTKAKIVADAEEQDQRRQAQLARQIDSINRLLADDESSPEDRYSREMYALNAALAQSDLELERYRRLFARMHKSISDRLTATTSGKEHTSLDRLMQMMTESDIPSYDGGHGRTSNGDRPDDEADQPSPS